MDRLNWDSVRDCAQAVLGLDPQNNDALAFLASVDRVLQNHPDSKTQEISAQADPISLPTDQPTSFANGRYQVKRFLGEGGKKKVYLAHDTWLNREVAFALIKSEGLDDTSRISCLN